MTFLEPPHWQFGRACYYACLKILPLEEEMGILKDAVTAHESAGDSDGHTEMHDAVARMNNGILAGGNSVRRKS
jgi:hypothetical protein